MSNEDVFICFILVALNCFLCPNSQLVPITKHIGIFEDIEHIGDLDWLGFVLEWLIDSIKTFNAPRTSAAKDNLTLGGCLYYMAVIYLDYVNFGHHQVPPYIPRILVWKENMIKSYSEDDMKLDGVYGLRPLLDISKTCHSKQSVFMHKTSDLIDINSEFMSKIKIVCGMTLPENLKIGICKLLEEHSINTKLTLNMDITSLANLSTDLKSSFSTLLEHVYSVDSRAQTLLLNLLKLVVDACPSKSPTEPNNTSQNGCSHDSNGNRKSFPVHVDDIDDVPKEVTKESDVHGNPGGGSQLYSHEAINKSTDKSINTNTTQLSDPVTVDNNKDIPAQQQSHLQSHTENVMTSAPSNPKLNTQDIKDQCKNSPLMICSET